MAKPKKAKDEDQPKTEQQDEIHAEDQEDGEDVARETMTGDLRDIILTVVRTQQKPWQQLTEDEQRSLAGSINSQCESIVAKAVRTIAADGRKVVAGQLEQVTIKDGLKLVVKVNKYDEQRHDICDSQGQAVLLVVADVDEYTGERAPAQVDKDQPGIQFEDDQPVADNGKATAKAA